MNKKCPFCGSEPEVRETTKILRCREGSVAQNIRLIEKVYNKYTDNVQYCKYEQTQYMIKCSNKKCIAYQIVKKFWNAEDAYKDWNKREEENN